MANIVVKGQMCMHYIYCIVLRHFVCMYIGWLNTVYARTDLSMYIYKYFVLTHLQVFCVDIHVDEHFSP